MPGELCNYHEITDNAIISDPEQITTIATYVSLSGFGRSRNASTYKSRSLSKSFGRFYILLPFRPHVPFHNVFDVVTIDVVGDQPPSGLGVLKLAFLFG